MKLNNTKTAFSELGFALFLFLVFYILTTKLTGVFAVFLGVVFPVLLVGHAVFIIIQDIYESKPFRLRDFDKDWTKIKILLVT